MSFGFENWISIRASEATLDVGAPNRLIFLVRGSKVHHRDLLITGQSVGNLLEHVDVPYLVIEEVTECGVSRFVGGTDYIWE